MHALAGDALLKAAMVKVLGPSFGLDARTIIGTISGPLSNDFLSAQAAAVLVAPGVPLTPVDLVPMSTHRRATCVEAAVALVHAHAGDKPIQLLARALLDAALDRTGGSPSLDEPAILPEPELPKAAAKLRAAAAVMKAKSILLELGGKLQAVLQPSGSFVATAWCAHLLSTSKEQRTKRAAEREAADAVLTMVRESAASGLYPGMSTAMVQRASDPPPIANPKGHLLQLGGKLEATLQPSGRFVATASLLHMRATSGEHRRKSAAEMEAASAVLCQLHGSDGGKSLDARRAAKSARKSASPVPTPTKNFTATPAPEPMSPSSTAASDSALLFTPFTAENGGADRSPPDDAVPAFRVIMSERASLGVTSARCWCAVIDPGAHLAMMVVTLHDGHQSCFVSPGPRPSAAKAIEAAAQIAIHDLRLLSRSRSALQKYKERGGETIP